MTAASENICSLKDMKKLMESARLIPFSLRGLLKPLNEKYCTGLATDFLLKSVIQTCKPKSTFDWAKQKFDKQIIEENKAAIKNAEEIQKLYEKESCGALTKMFENVMKYHSQLIFLKSLYEQLGDYYGDNNMKGEIEVPKDLMQKLYEKATALELPRKLGEMRLLEEFVLGPRTEDLIKEMDQLFEEEDTQMEVIQPEKKKEKESNKDAMEEEEEEQPIPKRTRGRKKNNNKTKKRNKDNESEDEQSDFEVEEEEEEEWKEEESDDIKIKTRNRRKQEKEAERKIKYKNEKVEEVKKGSKLKKLSTIEKEAGDLIISSEDLLAPKPQISEPKNKTSENLNTEDQDFVILIEEAEKQEEDKQAQQQRNEEGVKTAKKQGLTDMTNTDLSLLKTSKRGSNLHKPFTLPKMSDNPEKNKIEKKENNPEKMQIEEEEEKSSTKEIPQTKKTKNSLQSKSPDKTSDGKIEIESKDKKTAGTEKTSKRGRPFKVEKMVQEIEEEFQQKIKSLPKKVHMEEAQKVLGSFKTLTIDGKTRDAKWVQEQMKKIYAWKDKYEDCVEKKKSGLSELVEQIDDLGIKVPEMSKAIELNKAWKLWRNKAGGMNRKVKKKVENIYEDNEDMITIEDLEGIVREAEDLRYVDTEDGTLQELKTKLANVKKIQEKFHISGQMATFSHLKEADKKLKTLNVKIPELSVLKQKVKSSFF